MESKEMQIANIFQEPIKHGSPSNVSVDYIRLQYRISMFRYLSVQLTYFFQYYFCYVYSVALSISSSTKCLQDVIYVICLSDYCSDYAAYLTEQDDLYLSQETISTVSHMICNLIINVSSMLLLHSLNIVFDININVCFYIFLNDYQVKLIQSFL